MAKKYGGKIYVGNSKIFEAEGDDLEKLYALLLLKADGKFGDIHGEIVDLKSNQVVKRFNKNPPE